MDKRIIALIVIIVILAVGVCFGIFIHQNDTKPPVNKTVMNTTNVTNTTENTTVEETSSSSSSESGQYGYCAVCGNALSYSEAHNDYTQGKVCSSCAKNPYYQSGPGAQYANKKLEEAYPDEYSWMSDDSGDDYEDSYYDTEDF